MIRIKFSRNEPNSVPLSDLYPGHVFKMSGGRSAYMVLAFCEGIRASKKKDTLAVVSLESGLIHIFDASHPVVELEGMLELFRIKIERR